MHLREQVCKDAYSTSYINTMQGDLTQAPRTSYSLKRANESIPKMNRGNSCRQVMVWPLSEKASKQVNSRHYSIRALLCYILK